MKPTLLQLSLAALAVSPVYAQPAVQVTGTLPTIVHTTPTTSTLNFKDQAQPKVVLLQKIKLSQPAKRQLANTTSIQLKASNENENNSKSYVQLGMNNVPVLDQGAHGSCVTFATGGALDAVIGRGDYVSELCSLTLGNYLADNNVNYPSGWDGSWGSIVLSQMSQYGIISKSDQHNFSCGGLTEYPRQDPSQVGHSMTVKDYTAISESLKDKVKWTSLLRWQDAFSSYNNPSRTLKKVKRALKQGNRLTFGVLLDVNQGHTGALGSHHNQFDTWMLTDEIKNDADNGAIEAGHEMIITGFDDNAVVTAPDGTTNTGLLTLRNSWSDKAGDKGNYYMSYAHFKALTMEVQLIRKVNASS